MPHLYTTKPVNFPSPRWKHDREPFELIRIVTPERPYFVKIHPLRNGLLRLSLLTTPIDLILTRHKEILLTAAQQLGVHILQSNLGNRLKPDIGLERLLDEKQLYAFDWTIPQPKIFEIGTGNGAFLCEHAFRAPHTLHVGAEINGFTIRKALRKAARAQLTNIFFVRSDARYLLRYHFPPTCFDHIFIHFPDPWEKKRYLKRRLISAESIPNFARVLKPSGSLHFTTDHHDYADYTRQLFSETHLFKLAHEVENATLPFPTKYERKWRAQGRQIVQFVFRRTEHPYPFAKNDDQLFPSSFEIATRLEFSSGDILQSDDFLCVFKDVYKGPSEDLLDTVLTLGQFRWNVLFLKTPSHLIYDDRLNQRYLSHKIKEHLTSLLSGR